MCGRYRLRKPGLLKKHVFQTDFEEFSELKIEPRWNVAPSQWVPIVKHDRKLEKNVPVMARWGFVPSWERGKPKFRPSNARDDKVLKSGMYKASFDRRRCLVPADGFYEWLVIDPKTKQPFFFHFTDDRPWAFAGFYDTWHDDEKDETADRMTFITVAPNRLLEPFHDRMPVMLTSEADIERWMDPELNGEKVFDLLKPRPDDEKLVTHPVSRAMNRPQNESPENVVPISRDDAML